VGFGAIGFADDYAKVAKKNKAGISGRLRLFLEFAIAGAAMAYLFHSDLMNESIRLKLQLPFSDFSQHAMDLPAWAYTIFGAFVVVGTANAVNLTDGLDGLAIGPSIMNAGTFLIFAYIAGVETTIISASGTSVTIAEYLHIAHIDGTAELAIFAAALFGAGVGFLWYNTYPAQVFMGDVGALALGGGLAMLAVLTKNELLSVLLGGGFVVEAVSVLGQIFAFKVFGRRIFLMAPIHHHFEKKGWPEPKVIVRFWIISVMLAIASLSTLKLR
jgi:phospho-N-acetylmuramoyl-pentapeptide-transferase